MDIFNPITAYHWIALGLLLLTAEVLGTAGFLLGAAVAALGMGIGLWLLPDMSVSMQIIGYVIGAVAATVLYFQLFRDAQMQPARPLLNNRARRLVGHQFKLENDIEFGEGKVQIGDTFWQVRTDTPLSKGTLVEVTDTQRMLLVIAAR
jgi:membrane protein implicated in regulation of membrane protease activity